MNKCFLYADQSFGEKLILHADAYVAELSLLCKSEQIYTYEVLFLEKQPNSAPPRTLELQGQTYIRHFDSVYISPKRDDATYLSGVFDDLSKNYQCLIDVNTHQAIYSAIFRWLPLKFDKIRVLDFGCGVGLGANVFRALTLDASRIELYGCDISLLMLKQMPAEALSQYKTVCLIGDDKLPFPNNSFDFIILVFVAHLLGHDTVSDLFRVLKPYGRMIINLYKFSTYEQRYQQFSSHIAAKSISSIPISIGAQNITLLIVTKKGNG